MRNRRPPHANDRVADELLDHTTEPLDLRPYGRVIFLE
jgi:hypothetical protein